MTEALPEPASDWAMFFDFDGTLAEIAPTPGAVQVRPGLIDHLRSIQDALDGAVAIVSGRPLEEIDGFLAPLQLSAAGLHGLERRGSNGDVDNFVPSKAIIETLRPELRAFAAVTPGVQLEDKRLSLALHYRSAPDQGPACHSAMLQAVDHAEGALEVLLGKMVVELKPTGGDKGTAIEAFLREPPFLGRRPFFAGDDVTDEVGFASVNRLDGVSVCIGTKADSAARHQVESVAKFSAWLDHAAGLLAPEEQPTTRKGVTV